MIRLARSRRVTALVQGQQRLESLSRRFVGGPSASHAVECAAELRRKGIAASMFFLGEYVTDPSVVAVTVRQLTEVIELTAEHDLDVCASVDPTQIGLMIDEDTATRNARVLAEAVAQAAGHRPWHGHDALMVDMEDATVTDATLALHRTLSDAGLPVAVTIQAYLHRTRDDLPELIARGGWIRLVKGAFAEPATVAARHTADTDSRYRQAAALLLAPSSRDAGAYPVFATHDHRIIDEIATLAAANGWPPDAYEFEMLFGVRPDFQQELVRRGHRVRVYLPFGQAWFPYSIRRVGESPRNLRFAVSAVARRN